MLTRKQKEICDYILAYSVENARSPTLDEIRIHFGLRSVATIHKHLKAMEQRGAIRRTPGRARALEVVPLQNWVDSNELESLPVVDDIRAPFPADIDLIKQSKLVPTWMFQKQTTSGLPNIAHSIPYLFQQKNESLIELGIYTGDWFVVVWSEELIASNINAELMAITIDNLGSIVRLVKDLGDKLSVEAANPNIKGYTLDRKRVRICGRVTALLRANMQQVTHPASND